MRTFLFLCIGMMVLLSGAAAAANAIRTIRREKLTVRSLQEYHGNKKNSVARSRNKAL